MAVPTVPPTAVRSTGNQTSTASRTPSPTGTYTDWRRRDVSTITPRILARQARHKRPSAARTNPGTRPALSIGHGPVARPSTSVRDAGELLTGVLQLAGPLAGPAESAGGLAAHVGGRSTAGEVDVLAPVHPPRVGAAGVAGEVPGQLPEEPVHDLCPPAVPP